MAEIRNCSTCNGIFNYTGILDICSKCAREEEEMYKKVYQFLRIRENRTATVERIVEETGVATPLLFNWLRKGHLRASQFPNLGYPCVNCGGLIGSGRLCKSCTSSLRDELDAFEASKETISTLNETYQAHGKLKANK